MLTEAEFQKYVLPYAPLALTIIGWWVVAGTANKLQSRKEARAEVDACCVMTDDLLHSARKYHTTAPLSNEADTLAAREILFSLHRLLSRLQLLQDRYKKYDLDGAMSDLYEAINGPNFQSHERTVHSIDSDFIADLEYKVHFLMDALERGFDDNFGQVLAAKFRALR